MQDLHDEGGSQMHSEIVSVRLRTRYCGDSVFLHEPRFQSPLLCTMTRLLPVPHG